MHINIYKSVSKVFADLGNPKTWIPRIEAETFGLDGVRTDDSDESLAGLFRVTNCEWPV